MRNTMLRIFWSLSLLASVFFGFEQDAHAGIIITDGKTGERILPGTTSPITDDPEDDRHAQEIYLWASMVFGGHGDGEVRRKQSDCPHKAGQKLGALGCRESRGNGSACGIRCVTGG